METGKEFRRLLRDDDNIGSNSLFHARGATPPGFVTWIVRLLAFGTMLALAVLLMIHIRH